MISDFIPAAELSKLTRIPLGSIYNGHSAGRGPLTPILTKLGGRLGCWRSDYDLWVASQRRMKVPESAKQPTAA